MKEVTCLCWNCGREIYSDEEQHIVNEEIWCEECAKGTSDDERKPL